MSKYPDFSSHGYQITRELGCNHLGGRVTYLAQNLNTQQPVVIKQFQFAQLGANWAEYDAYQQEIAVLQSLNHPGIPRYLDSFQTPDGFCMVQEYLDAQSLAEPRSWTPQEIKQFALSILEILKYLQAQKPPLIHRDIKPENILIDSRMKVYLVDFGFARTGGGEVAASSVVKGTLGFMPPEQLFNRQLTEASDLYGLGATLICLLTGTPSVNIGNLIDSNYNIHFRHLVPPLQRGWINWLEKMAEPNPKNRYRSAAEALAALAPIDVNRLPKVRLSRDILEFTGSKLGEKVMQAIAVSNPIPDTVLAGTWEVAPHPNDPPHTPYEHEWISFQPRKFESNETECKIIVDTSKLLAGEIYTREILLRANSEPETHPISVRVHTAPLPKPQKLPYYYLFLAVLFPGCCCVGWQLGSSGAEVVWIILPMLTALFVTVDKIGVAVAAELDYVNYFDIAIKVAIGQFLGGMVGFLVSGGWDIGWLAGNLIGALLGTPFSKSLWAVIAGIVGLGCLLTGQQSLALSLAGIGLLYGGELLAILILSVPVFRMFKKIETSAKDVGKVTVLISGLGICLGAAYPVAATIALHLDYMKPQAIALAAGIAIAALGGTAFPLAYLTVYRSWQQRKAIAKYRRSEPQLIKP